MVKSQKVPCPKQPTKKPGTVYVMMYKDELRIGHHATSNRQREREFYRDTHECWKIVCSITLPTKLQATAAEAIAHAILEKVELKRKVAPGEVKRCLQIFTCGKKKGIEAIKQGAAIVTKIKKSKIINIECTHMQEK